MPSRAGPRRRSLPEDAFAALAALGQRGPRAQLGPGRGRSPARPGRPRRRTSSPRCAGRTRRTVAAEGGHNNEIGLPLTLTRIERGHRARRLRDGHARPRPDRRAVRDRPSGRGRDHEHRRRCTSSCSEPSRRSPRRRPRSSRPCPRAASRSSLTSRCSSPTSAVTTSRFAASAEQNVDVVRADRRRLAASASTSTERSSSSSSRSRRATRRRTRSQRCSPCRRSASRCPQGGSRSSSRAGAARSRRCPGGGLLINDSYNANPASMRAALEHLAGHEGRTVAVLGEMAELGPTAPEYHREVGELVERSRHRRRARRRRARARVRRRAGRRRSRGGRNAQGARPAGRRRPGQGLARSRARGRRGSPHRSPRVMERVLAAGIFAMAISILAGPKFIDVPAAQGVRPAHPRGGAGRPSRQAGHADDGRPADRPLDDHPVPRALASTRKPA